jgi:hypothetical protein
LRHSEILPPVESRSTALDVVADLPAGKFFEYSPWVGRLFAFSRSTMKFGVFIERDGVLNQALVERSQQVSPLSLGHFRINPAAAGLVRKLKAAGFVVVATTNQPGLSRGYQSRRALDQMHALLMNQVPLDDILVCPHDETDHCPCRGTLAGSGDA